MELVMAVQDDATPWTSPPRPGQCSGAMGGIPLRGRGHFSELGAVRTKPCQWSPHDRMAMLTIKRDRMLPAPCPNPAPINLR